jgi:LysM repeat protein
MASLPRELGAPLAKTNRSRGAAITVSPITLQALGARGAAGTLPALHVVKRGETLQSIATRYNLPVTTLANINNLNARKPLPSGAKLRLPRAINLTYEGRKVAGDVDAMMAGEISVAPFRFLFEQQGGTMTWE